MLDIVGSVFGSLRALFAVLLVFGALRSVIRRAKSTLVSLPPGPPGHWLLGNKIPSVFPYRKFEEWTVQYGPIFSLRQGSVLVVVIGRHDAAVDILEKEGSSLADRPRSISAGETLSGGMRLLLLGAPRRLRKLRRALHAQLQPKMAITYEPVQMQNAQNLILDIISDPTQHQVHAKRYAASVILTMTYGKTTPTNYSDPVVQKINRCLAHLGAAVRPGTYRVDSFPLLRYVPGYLSELRKQHLEELALFRSQLDAVRAKMVANEEVRPCFAKYIIEEQKEYDLTDDELAYLAGSMFGAGADTTASAITIVIMAAACFPEAQSEVQKELDLVVGRGRLPRFSDEGMLPQVTAFYLECYRWRPVSAGGFAHRATQDIIWRGYRIPAGATVIGNHWSIARSPDVFPDPEKFDPQRWIGPDGAIRDDLRSFNFGFGRRVCPGAQVANKSLFVNTALLMWAFRISQDPSAPIDTLAFTQTANVHALPFNVNFEPRLEKQDLTHLMEPDVE